MRCGSQRPAWSAGASAAARARRAAARRGRAARVARAAGRRRQAARARRSARRSGGVLGGVPGAERRPLEALQRALVESPRGVVMSDRGRRAAERDHARHAASPRSTVASLPSDARVERSGGDAVLGGKSRTAFGSCQRRGPSPPPGCGAPRPAAGRCRHPSGRRAGSSRTARIAAATGSGAIGTTRASRPGLISSCTQGRSETTHGVPLATASHTLRGDESEEAIETQTSDARYQSTMRAYGTWPTMLTRSG